MLKMSKDSDNSGFQEDHCTENSAVDNDHKSALNSTLNSAKLEVSTIKSGIQTTNQHKSRMYIYLWELELFNILWLRQSLSPLFSLHIVF